MLKQAKTSITSRVVLLAVLGLSSSLFNSAMAQCTTGAWTSTTGTVAAIGSETNPEGLPYEGTCGLTVDATDAPAFVTTSAPANETLLLGRFYIYPNDIDLTSGDVELLKARGNSSTQLKLSLRESGGDLELVTAYRSGDSLVEHNELITLRPVWQAITFGWSADDLGGSLYVRIDGKQQFQIDNLDNGDEFVANIDFGIVNDAAATGTLVLDAFEARRANPEPPLLTNEELVNISTRAPVGTGTFVVVGGFIIRGDTKKCVVIRGRGRSMNVSATRLADPTLTLRRAGNPTVLEFNDDWQESPFASRIQELNRQPTRSEESAIYTCLEPGGYTADLKSVIGQTLGLGIIEVFDGDTGTPYLRNISTRAESVSGDEVVIAGFVIGGTEQREVLIRGRGPSVNVPEARLGAPSIELRQGPALVTSNTGWTTAANAAGISATGLAPGLNEESSILATLDPGAYTVIMRSSNNSPGIGIIEVFDLSGGSVTSN